MRRVVRDSGNTSARRDSLSQLGTRRSREFRSRIRLISKRKVLENGINNRNQGRRKTPGPFSALSRKSSTSASISGFRDTALCKLVRALSTFGRALGEILLKLQSALPSEAQDLLADHLDRNILSLRPWNTQWTSLAGLLKLTHPFFEQPQPFFRRLHSHLRSRQGVYRAHSELSD